MPRPAEVNKIPGHDAQGIEHSNINSDVSSVPEKKVVMIHNIKHKTPTEREYLHQLWKAQAEKRAAEKQLQARQRNEEDVRRQYRLPSQAPSEREYSARLWARPEGARASCRIARKRQRGVTAARTLVDLSEGGCVEDGCARDGALGEEEPETKKQTIQRGSITTAENQYGSLWDQSKLPTPKPRHISPKQKQKQIEKKLQLRMQKYDSKYMPRKTAPDPRTWEENYERTVRFKDRCEMLPLSGQLYDWLEEQKKNVDNLSDEQRHRLNELGVSWGHLS